MLNTAARRRLIVALDSDNLQQALRLAKLLRDRVGLFKVGSRLFTAAGPEAIRKLATLRCQVFLDLKFHDIPTTVAGAVRTAAAYRGVSLVNLHALGGEKMLRQGVQAFREGKACRRDLEPKLLAVTILTSLDTADLEPLGIRGPADQRALELARLAKRHGLDGVVASGRDVAALRRAFGPNFILLVPGVRSASSLGRTPDDQRRTVTAGEAIRAGADYVVVGRPITAAADPRSAADAIVAEIAAALRRRN